MTSRQIMTMVAIGHLQEDQTTLNNIARKLGTSKQSVKQIITIMERKGYTVTVPSQQDKRAVNVKITEYGKQALLEVSERSIYFFAKVFKDLKTEEIETLWGLLKKLYRLLLELAFYFLEKWIEVQILRWFQIARRLFPKIAELKFT